MKSEHRRELHANDLQRLTQQVGNRLRAYLEKYGMRLVLLLAGLCIVAAAGIYWVRSSGSSNEAGWTQLAISNTAEDYANVADEFQGAAVGAWARLKEAEAHLREGIRQTFTHRAASLSDLKQARRAFEAVLKDPSAPDEVRERAQWGLARCLESISGVQAEDSVSVDEAISAYEHLIETFPDTVYKELAEQRIKVLKSGAGREFYAWFRQQDPKPEEDIEPPQDRGGLPQGHPPLDASLPSIPPELQLRDDAVESGDERPDEGANDGGSETSPPQDAPDKSPAPADNGAAAESSESQ